MKKFLKSLSALFIAAFSLTSCMPEGTTEVTFPIEYDPSDLVMGYYVKDAEGATVVRATAPQLAITRSLSDGTLLFQVRQLYSTGGTISFTTEALPYKMVQDKLIISSPQLIAGNVELQNFSFIGYYNWMTLQFTCQGYTYVINTRYTISQQIAPGTGNVKFTKYVGLTSVSGTPFDENGYVTDKTDYGISIQDAGIVNVYMLNAKFADKMPDGLQLLIPGLQMNMGEKAYIFYSTGPINPYSVTSAGQGEPWPDYVINDFIATIPYDGSNGTLSFKCSPAMWSVDVTGMEIAPILVDEPTYEEF